MDARCAVPVLGHVVRAPDGALLPVEPIKADLALSDTQLSLVLGPASRLAYALFGVILGWTSDRYPRRWVIFCGAILWNRGHGDRADGRSSAC